MYKTESAAFIRLPWDTRTCPYVCLYCVKKLFNTYNVITKKYWNKNEQNEQKVGCCCKKNTIVIHTLNFAQVKSMDDNCGEWVECMGVASGCGEQEAGVASGTGWNL